MSMSEFEREWQEGSEADPSGVSIDKGIFPDDFSAEEIDFARELQDLFALNDENIPPFYVQTLMDAETPAFQSVENGFEKKTSARVFRQLKLNRRLFRPERFSMGMLFHSLSISRPLMTFGIGCLLFMFLTMALTSRSFAYGLNDLWKGALWSGDHSGVLQVNRYPTIPADMASSHSSQNYDYSDTGTSLLDAQQWLQFPVFLPQYMSPHFTQQNIYLYQADQSWADGPVLVLDYSYLHPGSVPRQLAICEFKPRGKVLQVVQNGAAQKIQIGQEGASASSAIYVEGQWMQDDSAQPSWVHSDRNELIFEDANSGVVFWIVGDKRAGITSDELSKIGNSLHVLQINNNMMINERIGRVIQSQDVTSWVFADDVIYLDNPDSSVGPSFKLIGSSTHKAPFHPHLLDNSDSDA